jgi:cell division control protein 12
MKQLDKLTEVCSSTQMDEHKLTGCKVDIIKAELEEKGFKVKLTVIDTPGFGDYVNNRDSWYVLTVSLSNDDGNAFHDRLPITEFVDDQHEMYMRQEQQPDRRAKIDLRVHACVYFIRATGHTYVYCRLSSLRCLIFSG